MTLHVDSESIIIEVQERFQHLYPNLKLEFIYTPYEKLNPSTELKRSYPYIRIGELSRHSRKNSLDINDSMTVSELEKKFRKKFGLPAMIYRKSGEYWMKKRSLGGCTLKH